MSLPKWFFERNQDIYVKANRLEQCFEIMWEALEEIIGDDTEPLTDEGTKAKEALRRIEEIGK